MSDDRNAVYYKGQRAKPTPNALKRQIRKTIALLQEFPGYESGDCDIRLIRCGNNLNAAFQDMRELEVKLKTLIET